MSNKKQKPKETSGSKCSIDNVLAAFPDSFLVLDFRGKITHAHIRKNETQVVIGDPEQIKGKSIKSALNSLVSKKIKERLAGFQESDKDLSFEIRISHNSTRSWFEIRIKKACEDQVLLVIRNITALFSKINEKVKFFNIAEQSQELILISDVTGTIEYVNPMISKVTGYSFNELAGQNARIFKSGKHESSFYFKLWSNILKGKSYRAEFHNAKKNGEIYIEEKTITPLYDTDGHITNFISTGIDVTQQRRDEQKALKYKQLQVTIDKKEQKSRTLSLIKSNEIERNKFAREIHEGVNQMLSAAMTNLESLSAKRVITGEEKSRIELINQMVSEITQELRGISNSLSPISLYEFGLFLAVEQMVKRATAANKGIKINFGSNLARTRFKPEIEINVYRIIQEAIRNILQHAGAQKIVLGLHYNDACLNLFIKDNGRGIPMNNLEFKKISTFGILNMEARARSIGAELTIKSGKDKGFAIDLSLNTKIKPHD